MNSQRTNKSFSEGEAGIGVARMGVKTGNAEGRHDVLLKNYVWLA